MVNEQSKKPIKKPEEKDQCVFKPTLSKKTEELAKKKVQFDSNYRGLMKSVF